MNTDINSTDGSWGEAPIIEYDTSSLEDIQGDLASIQHFLNEILDNMDVMVGHEHHWEGEAKIKYTELKDFLRRYEGDYSASIDQLKACADGLETLFNSIPSSQLMQEVDSI